MLAELLQSFIKAADMAQTERQTQVAVQF